MVICDVIGIYDYVAIFPTSVLTLSERQYISGDIFGWKVGNKGQEISNLCINALLMWPSVPLQGHQWVGL